MTVEYTVAKLTAPASGPVPPLEEEEDEDEEDEEEEPEEEPEEDPEEEDEDVDAPEDDVVDEPELPDEEDDEDEVPEPPEEELEPPEELPLVEPPSSSLEVPEPDEPEQPAAAKAGIRINKAAAVEWYAALGRRSRNSFMAGSVGAESTSGMLIEGKPFFRTHHDNVAWEGLRKLRCKVVVVTGRRLIRQWEQKVAILRASRAVSVEEHCIGRVQRGKHRCPRGARK
jgi:hypothetical protein